MNAPLEMLRVEHLAKDFTLHLQGGVRIDVLADIGLGVGAGECVALTGPSGAGKSTLLRCLYGNYRAAAGRILVRHDGAMIDLVTANPRAVIEIRRRSLGYVSQFLRVVPRVPAVAIVAEAAMASGMAAEEAHRQAADLLSRLAIPPRLQALPPATFSGGEQQRVNLARGFIGAHPILLLDEPTASLDAANAASVVAMVQDAKARGIAIVCICHDVPVRDAIADRLYAVPAMQDAA